MEGTIESETTSGQPVEIVTLNVPGAGRFYVTMTRILDTSIVSWDAWVHDDGEYHRPVEGWAIVDPRFRTDLVRLIARRMPAWAYRLAPGSQARETVIRAHRATLAAADLALVELAQAMYYGRQPSDREWSDAAAMIARVDVVEYALFGRMTAMGVI
jgi:hypothetical protein